MIGHGAADLQSPESRAGWLQVGSGAVSGTGWASVVPEKFGRRLYSAYDRPKRIWELPDGNHETVMLQPASFWKEIAAFWRANRNQSSARKD